MASQQSAETLFRALEETLHTVFKEQRYEVWPVPGSEDTELGVLMEPEVGHGEAEVYTRVQA